MNSFKPIAGLKLFFCAIRKCPYKEKILVKQKYGCTAKEEDYGLQEGAYNGTNERK